MSVRRTAALEAKDGHVASYVHNRVADGLGKIGVLVALDTKGAADAVAEIGRQIALHIAAANPQAVSPEDLDKALIERERQVYLEQARASGKSEDIVAKMVEGRLRKEFYSQVVLLQQVFFGPGGDSKMTVEQYLKGAEKAAGAPVKVKQFVRFVLGEGIDRKGDDFASEVAKLAKGG
jgi:elongation factor Ts